MVGSLKQLNLGSATPASVLQYFENGWSLYETLMRCFRSDDDYYRIANPLRRPLVFYLGHTAVFYVNKFVAAGILTVSFPSSFSISSSNLS